MPFAIEMFFDAESEAKVREMRGHYNTTILIESPSSNIGLYGIEGGIDLTDDKR